MADSGRVGGDASIWVCTSRFEAGGSSYSFSSRPGHKADVNDGQNIFISSISPKVTVKIGDFGISKRIVAHPSASTAATFLRTRVYTPDYAAPEVVQQEAGPNGVYTSAVDLWSLGCITHEILTGHTPFPHPFALFKYCGGDRSMMQEIKGKGLSPEAVEFVTRMLEPDAQERPKAMDAKWMPWVRALTTAVDLEVVKEEALKTEMEELKKNHESLMTRYKNVKRLYFEQKGELEKLNSLVVTSEEHEKIRKELDEERDMNEAKQKEIEDLKRELLEMEALKKELAETTTDCNDYRRLYSDNAAKLRELQESGVTLETFTALAKELMKEKQKVISFEQQSGDDSAVELAKVTKDMEDLTTKYRKVKAIYFERNFEVEMLQKKVADLEAKNQLSQKSEWEKEQEECGEIFNKIEKARPGVLNGDEAVDFFKKFGVTNNTLEKIWDLADFAGRGWLDRYDFAVAMHYIRQQKNDPDTKLPNKLPLDMQPKPKDQTDKARGSLSTPSLTPPKPLSPPKVDSQATTYPPQHMSWIKETEDLVMNPTAPMIQNPPRQLPTNTFGQSKPKILRKNSPASQKSPNEAPIPSLSYQPWNSMAQWQSSSNSSAPPLPPTTSASSQSSNKPSPWQLPFHNPSPSSPLKPDPSTALYLPAPLRPASYGPLPSKPSETKPPETFSRLDLKAGNADDFFAATDRNKNPQTKLHWSSDSGYYGSG